MARTEQLRLGILACDEVNAELAALYGQYPPMFERLLRGIDAPFSYSTYRVYAGEFPPHVADCDAYLLTGSKRSVYEDLAWIKRLAAFVRDVYAARRPQVGICFGHQMLGLALGGSAELAPQGWGLGRQEVTLGAHPHWMQASAERYALYVANQDQVTRLPAQALLLAHSAQCPNAMFAIDNLVLGIQGHPEFELGYARAITENKRGIAPADVIDAALASFGPAPDAALVARWIVGFLAQ
jgi:GMP synthase-like glutamine amidotransferase